MTLEPAANRILGTRPNDDDSVFQLLRDGPNLLHRGVLLISNFFGEDRGVPASGIDAIGFLPAASRCRRETARYRAVFASCS